ncbi:uncharacterized protein [Solanum tuberosum]|uniref:Ubiquitin-protein ligase n=1 Tax=Solanum tuberosum TaxID=4113 RepID=M1CAC7_SOLTU|nr:PREDICTED: uncharacterized protein LOC102586577 [Solanum tuberosum]
MDAIDISRQRKLVIPWLMLPPEGTVYKFYRLAEGDVIQFEQRQQQEPARDVYYLGSLFQGWLVYIQQKDCQVFLFNPISGRKIKLPSVETLPEVKGVIRNTQTGLIETFLNYQSHPRTPQQLSKYIIRKMVLSSSLMNDDCVAMVTYGHSDLLAFCRRPGREDSTNCWIPLDGPLRQYTQIVYHSQKKLFFALTHFRDLEAWDLNTDPINRFHIHNEHFGTSSSNEWPIVCNEWPISFVDDDELERKSSYCWDSDYLVYDHQTHELFIVTRYIAPAIDQDGTLILPEDNLDDQFPYQTLTFDVFKLDFINHDHVELQYNSSLGNRTFFIGSNTGFALSTTQFPELKPNSIYFTDDLTWAYRHREKLKCGGHDLGIYDYKEGSFSSCYYPIDLDKIQRILPAPIWFTPDPDVDVDAECLA